MTLYADTSQFLLSIFCSLFRSHCTCFWILIFQFCDLLQYIRTSSPTDTPHPSSALPHTTETTFLKPLTTEMSCPVEAGNEILVPFFSAETAENIIHIKWSQSLVNRSADYYAPTVYNITTGECSSVLHSFGKRAVTKMALYRHTCFILYCRWVL